MGNVIQFAFVEYALVFWGNGDCKLWWGSTRYFTGGLVNLDSNAKLFDLFC